MTSSTTVLSSLRLYAHLEGIEIYNWWATLEGIGEDLEFSKAPCELISDAGTAESPTLLYVPESLRTCSLHKVRLLALWFVPTTIVMNVDTIQCGMNSCQSLHIFVECERVGELIRIHIKSDNDGCEFGG